MSRLHRLVLLVAVLVTALFATTTSIASPASQAETRVWDFWCATQGCAGVERLEVPGMRRGNEGVRCDFASDSSVAAEGGAKAFSKEKQALVDMAKADKKVGGVTPGDMKAYEELNQGLTDPFPADKVRGPETHPLRTPESTPGPGQSPHGHVGPVSHIPVKD